MLFCILNKARDNQNDNQSDREGRDDGYRLKIAHAALGEDKRNGQENQQDRPEELHAGRRVLVAAQFLVAVLAGDERDAVKARGMEQIRTISTSLYAGRWDMMAMTV